MINEARICCMSLIIMTWLPYQPSTWDAFEMSAICTSLPGGFWQLCLLQRSGRWKGKWHNPPPPTPHFPSFLAVALEFSLINAHAYLWMSLGSDRLERGLRIITSSGLVYDQTVALHYLEGSVNKALMPWMRILYSTLCWVQWNGHCYNLGFGYR